jgi:hypothetical protein
MDLETKQERRRVVTDKVLLQNVSVPVPKGEYDIHIDSQIGPDGERHMTAAQLILDQDALTRMGRSGGIPPMQCEVLRYLKSGDIVPA